MEISKDKGENKKVKGKAKTCCLRDFHCYSNNSLN